MKIAHVPGDNSVEASRQNTEGQMDERYPGTRGPDNPDSFSSPGCPSWLFLVSSNPSEHREGWWVKITERKFTIKAQVSYYPGYKHTGNLPEILAFA